MSILPQQWPRGPRNGLHRAAKDGSAERTLSLLSSGLIDIDQGDSDGWTPLLFAAGMGHSRVVVILLRHGANVSVVANDRHTALLVSAYGGYLVATTILIKAGADLEATDMRGATPLHRAAFQGCHEVVTALIEAGAKVDCRMNDGATPLFVAAYQGHTAAVRILLRANADPLIASANSAKRTDAPLGVAALNGHAGAVRELVQQVGIERCGGESSGVTALRLAAEKERIDTMAILVGAGVTDTGEALMVAAELGREASVKFLLQQLEDKPAGLSAYASTRGAYGRTPLISSIDTGVRRLCSPRVTRLLLDAGADTSPSFTFRNMEGFEVHNGTPLALTTHFLREKIIGGKLATEEQLRRLEAVRNMLLQEKAIHVVSWLWPNHVRRSKRAADGATSADKTATAATSLRMTVPILRRRAKGRGVLLPAFFR